jgi:methionine-S-sulfoxide reductase
MQEKIVFGGGCFWCTEAVFKMIKGVQSVIPGYAGGDKPNPTYEEVCRGDTDYAEVVEVIYDPGLVKLEDLLTIFFASHDPTTLNRQGNDIGTQYRSIIFYTKDDQKFTIEKFIKDINDSNSLGDPVVTELKFLDNFYEAEKYHQDYFRQNPGNPYCKVVINPKLEKVQEKFAKLLKN